MKKPEKEAYKAHKALFYKALDEFRVNNKGCINIFEYIEKEYKGKKAFYFKIARKLGFRAMKREGVYYMEV